MASTTTETDGDTKSVVAVAATVGMALIGVALTQLLTPMAKAHTPQWLWITDHCPNSDFACGSPQLGLFIPAVIATLIITVPYLAGYFVATTENEEGD